MDYSLLIGLHTLEADEFDDETLDRDPVTCTDQFMFYRDFNGGFQSSFEDNRNGPEVYYLGTHGITLLTKLISTNCACIGIIDILTPYSLTKKLEHTFKSLVFPKNAISAVNPSDYARRFLKFMSSNILQNVASDYGGRSLPLLPEVEETEDEQSGFREVKSFD